jgi:hypothetical protein
MLDWLPVREYHLQHDLQRSRYTDDLFKQYKKHLGNFRFRVLIEGQLLVVPERVNQLLKLGRFSFLTPVVPLYKLSRRIKLDKAIKYLLLPKAYHEQIAALDAV